MNHSIMANKLKSLYFTIGVIFILLIWEILSITYNNEIIFPSILQTLKALGMLFSKSNFYYILLYTLLRVLISIIASFVIGCFFAILSYLKNAIALIISPIISLIKTLPIASIIIVMIILLGHELSPYFISGFVILPIIYEGIYGGLKKIDQEVLDEVKTISNFNSIVLRDVYIPLISNDIKTSLLQSVGLGIKVMVMAEFISQPTYSIGRALLDARNNLDYDIVFAWTFILVIIVIVLEILLKQKRFKEI